MNTNQSTEISIASKRRNAIKRLVLNALFAALFVVFAVFLTIPLPAPIGEFSFSSLPIIICAFLFGPIDAVLVATVGTFLEQLLRYGLSPTMPLWMLPFILQALFVGLAVKALPMLRHQKLATRKQIIAFIAVVCLAELLLTAGNTAAGYLDGLIWNYPTKALHLIVLPRTFSCLIRAALSCVLVFFLLPPVQKLFLMRKNS